MGFNYVNIVGDKCKGWLNLFFDDECVAMVANVELADRIRKEIQEKKWEEKSYSSEETEEFIPY